MSQQSKIQWTDATWNPIRGCSRISLGCGGPNHQGGCYAEKIAARFSDPGQPFHGFAKRTPHGGTWTGKLALIDDALTIPLKWKKPRRIFVNSMSDLFHENLPDEAIDKVFAVMVLCPQHTFQVLTKRPERMREYCSSADVARRIWRAADTIACDLYLPEGHPSTEYLNGGADAAPWPLPQVWLGTSIEDQATADERIPHLLRTPASVRFVSAEPLLGPVDLTRVYAIPHNAPLNSLSPSGCAMHANGHCLGDCDWRLGRGLDWVIVGGESGPGARLFDVAWARSIVEQCAKSGTACFVKQLGANVWNGGERIKLRDRKGGDMSEWPAELRVREMPR